MAACIEVHHDEKGIVWPASVAPFEAVVIVAQQNDAAVAGAGERAYQALLGAGVDVIIDDRPDRAGVKFSDAELVGIPFRITIGKRGLASNTAELTDRATGETVSVPLDDLAKHVREAVAQAIALTAAGPIAKSAILSGRPQSVIFRGDDPPYPPVCARAGQGPPAHRKTGVLTSLAASSTVSFAESIEQHHHHPIPRHVGSLIVCSNVSATARQGSC